MFGLGTIIPLKTGLEVVAQEIEKQLGFPVLRYEIIMKVDNDTLDFKVWKQLPGGGYTTEMYNYPQSLIKDTIKNVAEQQINTDNEKLDYAVIHFDNAAGAECFANIYFTNSSGEKQTIKHII